MNFAVKQKRTFHLVRINHPVPLNIVRFEEIANGMQTCPFAKLLAVFAQANNQLVRITWHGIGAALRHENQEIGKCHLLLIN